MFDVQLLDVRLLMTGVPGGTSEEQVAYFAAKGYGVCKGSVAKTHAGEPCDGKGPVAYLGDGAGRFVAYLDVDGRARWWINLYGWAGQWDGGWRVSVFELPHAQ